VDRSAEDEETVCWKVRFTQSRQFYSAAWKMNSKKPHQQVGQSLALGEMRVTNRFPQG